MVTRQPRQSCSTKVYFLGCTIPETDIAKINFPVRVKIRKKYVSNGTQEPIKSSKLQLSTTPLSPISLQRAFTVFRSNSLWRFSKYHTIEFQIWLENWLWQTFATWTVALNAFARGREGFWFRFEGMPSVLSSLSPNNVQNTTTLRSKWLVVRLVGYPQVLFNWKCVCVSGGGEGVCLISAACSDSNIW